MDEARDHVPRCDLQARIRELEHEIAQLRADREDRERHFRVVAHEMKAPVAVTIQLLDAAGILVQDDDVRQLIRRARRRSDATLAMLRDMLDYIRLGQPDDEPDRAPLLEPVPTLTDLLQEHEEAGTQQGVVIFRDLGGDDACIRVSERDFRLVADNLVSNAIRYSKRDVGGGRIWVTTTVESGQFSLSVRDEGIGMTEFELKNIFSEFYRTTTARRQTGSGSGLGLAIVKRIADRAEATIEIRSRRGHGSLFRIAFPLA